MSDRKRNHKAQPQRGDRGTDTESSPEVELESAPTQQPGKSNGLKEITIVQSMEEMEHVTNIYEIEQDISKSQQITRKDYVIMQSNKGPDTFIEKFLILMSYVILIITFPFSVFFMFVMVRQFERVVILRNGKVRKNRAYGPGLIHYLPCIDYVRFIDLRIICYAVPPQEALTKDSLTVTVDAVVFYKVCDPVWAVINVAQFESSTRYLAATTLRNAIGTRKLSSLLVERPAVSFQVFQLMRKIAEQWGIRVVRVEIKDISLPLQLQKAMAAEAESSRLANAKIIVAQAEIESAKNLQQATTLLLDNPLCMQLRYLQSLQMIASDKTHTIVFPFSIEALKQMFK